HPSHALRDAGACCTSQNQRMVQSSESIASEAGKLQKLEPEALIRTY
ncbi:hypothetical protein A2U01_0068561, partial [Trifolium medium]|nr:hypothetical protein [Trifolium medium]